MLRNESAMYIQALNVRLTNFHLLFFLFMSIVLNRKPPRQANDEQKLYQITQIG